MYKHVVDWWFLYALLGLVIVMAIGAQLFERNKVKIHDACLRQQKINIAAGINPDKAYYECHPFFDLLAEKNKKCFNVTLTCYNESYNPASIAKCQEICKDELRK